MPTSKQSRRGFLSTTALLVSTSRVWSQTAPRLRAAVIGHTGRGNYGHGLENVWADVDAATLVAVADANPDGLKKTASRVNAKGFGDYREMLEKAKPDLVAVGPRWLDQHHDMVMACVAAGVKGIYLEKPMCRSLEEADEMVAACEKSSTKLAMATQARYSPRVKIISDMIADGRLGDIVEIRARGKDDHRGGGEDLWVLGTHMLDLMSLFGGDAKSCFAQVFQDGRPMTRDDIKEGNEGIGPLAGDEIQATYRLANGVTGYWASKRNMKGNPSRFGIRIQGTKGVVELYDTGYLPYVCYLPASTWSSGRSGKDWLPITSNGIGKAETLGKGGLHEGNVAAVKDLIGAIREDRQPKASIYEARKTIEMIAGVFESHRLKKEVTIPLENRKNPLTMG